MALAQETPSLLLDEPTTFLDPAAQIALLDIVRSLNRDLGRTAVMVLHDLNLAARYADNLVVLKDGQIVAAGPPREVMTRGMLRDVFAVEADVFVDPRTGTPLCLPYAHRKEERQPGATNDGLTGYDEFLSLATQDGWAGVGAEAGAVGAH
jgi:iron complex transport system ATP-binding protein